MFSAILEKVPNPFLCYLTKELNTHCDETKMSKSTRNRQRFGWCLHYGNPALFPPLRIELNRKITLCISFFFSLTAIIWSDPFIVAHLEGVEQRRNVYVCVVTLPAKDN